jgi:hypothetical protein
MRQAAAAVEQARNRVREQRAAGDRPCHHFRRLHDLGRQQIDQVLRKSPDRRRVAEQLVRIEVDAAVIAVAVVEMPIQHQDA